jgi:hypothetical protein
MSTLETKQKVLEGLKSRTINVAISYGDMKDENFKKYKYGEHTLRDFVDTVSDETPYTLVETINNNFLLIDRKINLPPQTFLDPEKIKTLFEETSRQALVDTFPEMTEVIESSFKEINTAGCTGCAKNSKTHQFVQEILYLDNTERDTSKVQSLFGEKFLTALKTFPKQQRPNQRPGIPAQPQSVSSQVPQNTPHTLQSSSSSNSLSIPAAVGESGPRPSCVECCMKHIGTAIVLLEEAANGYPAHRWLAAGELNEAANETLRDFPEVAKEIREYRHMITSNTKKIPNLMLLLNKLDKTFFQSILEV